MKLTKLNYGILFAVAIFCSCVKPFNPDVSTVNQNILVVEGFINTGSDTTKITLSHTVTIGNKNSSVAETGATLTVEDATGVSYPVPETTVKGSYASKGALALSSGKQYRLRIKTLGGKTYLSDLVDSKTAPPIDSIGYTNQPGTMQLYVNSHDDGAKSIYYKYSFSEAWRFQSKITSGWISNGKNGATPRTAAQDVSFCYSTDSATFIILNSTAALSKDVVYQFPINSMSDTSEKLGIRYSILVSQQTLTKDGYTFWQNLKKNTEQLGSIFDAQPSAISGNIHNISNSTEPVIGFISAGTIQKKRIYINKANLPANYAAGYPANCAVNPYPAEVVDSTNGPPVFPPYWAWPMVIRLPSTNRIVTADPATSPTGISAGPFMFTTDICADCTLRGKLAPPPFWKP